MQAFDIDSKAVSSMTHVVTEVKAFPAGHLERCTAWQEERSLMKNRELRLLDRTLTVALSALFALSILFAPQLGFAQATPLGNEFQVNTYTTNSQAYPSVALDADGDFVVVWQSQGSGGTDPSGGSIQGQLYAADGSTVGSEFQINTYTTFPQTWPSVAMDADGDFVVVWHSYGSGGTDSSSYSVQGQRYTSDGSTVGGEFQVNTYTTSYQFYPSVALDADGDFVVVWHSYGSGGTDSSFFSIQGQRYASDGSTVGGEFQVNTYTNSYQNSPSVAMDADGDFVVVWQSTGSGGSDSDSISIQGQRYASDGSTVGGEFQVNTYTTSLQRGASVGLDAAGDFVVVWQSYGSDGTDLSSFSVQGQRYASNGATVGGEFQVNTYTTSYQGRSSVGLAADGDFVVVWRSTGSGGTDLDSFSVQGQRYASDGSALGGEFQVNTYTTSYQFYPSVGLDETGDFVVVWRSLGSSGTDESSFSIQGQRYAVVADLAITMSDDPDPVSAGDDLTYILGVTNNGPSDDPETVTVSDTLPSGVTFVSVNGIGWTCAEAAGVVTCTRAGLAVGAAPSISVVVTVDFSTTDTLNNLAAVSSPSTDSVPGNDSVNEPTTVITAADLAITKDDGVTSASPGDTLTYTIVASNAGPGDAAAVSVTDTFPADLTCGWTSFADGGATGNSTSSGDLNDTLGMPVGSSVTYTVACDTDPSNEGLVSNTATISSLQNDPVPGNNSATDTTVVTELFADGFESGNTSAWTTAEP